MATDTPYALKIWYFAGDLLLVEYAGRPYAIDLGDTGKAPVHLAVNPSDTIDCVFERYMKFSFVPWFHGHALHQPQTTARLVLALLEGEEP